MSNLFYIQLTIQLQLVFWKVIFKFLTVCLRINQATIFAYFYKINFDIPFCFLRKFFEHFSTSLIHL